MKRFTFHEFVARCEEQMLGRQFDSLSLIAVSDQDGAVIHLSACGEKGSPLMVINDFFLGIGSLCDDEAVKNITKEQKENFVEFAEAVLQKIKNV